MFFTLLSPKPSFPNESPLFNDPFFALPEQAFPDMQVPAMPVKNSLDVLDIGKSLLIVMPNPHMSNDKIKMNLRKGNILTIEGTEQKKNDKKDKHSNRSQTSYTSFSHQVKLPPEKVDLKKAQFHIDEHSDLLIITLNKTHPEKETK